MVPTWQEEVNEKWDRIKQFATTVNERNGFLWAGRHSVILHYDLTTTDRLFDNNVYIGDLPGVDRSQTYAKIEHAIRTCQYQGLQLASRVWNIPMGERTDTVKFARQYWNYLAHCLEHKLLPGDVFYLHFPNTALNMGVYGQLVHNHSLHVLPVPD